MNKISYRHNAMNIDSLNTFVSVKGGFNNGIRDVFFVRAVGEAKNINDLVIATDEQMSHQQNDARVLYIRHKALPNLIEKIDVDYYAVLYSNLILGQAGSFRNIAMKENLMTEIILAWKSLLEIYKNTRNNLTPSMERNLGVKILYWLDHAMNHTLDGWTERSCIKVVADNVIKEQEYLFYLFLTLIGCDVYLIQNKYDIDLPGKLLSYSQKIAVGVLGTTDIVRYNVQHKEYETNETKPKEAQRQKECNPIVSVPRREPRRVEKQDTRISLSQGASMSKEKSFEELACYASSVVMIGVHNDEGEVIGTGSGIMIGRKGYILTNYHVVSDGRFYSVKIEDDEQTYSTNEVVKYNSMTDLAIIRIKRELKPIPVYMGEKKLVRGLKVVAIGSPLGLFNSVSDGIISGFRNIEDVNMIQFTAPISHGSSGGAVLNMQGELIGISTAGIDRGQNINLAIGYENIRIFTSGFIF